MQRIGLFILGFMMLYLGKSTYDTGKFVAYIGYMIELGTFKYLIVTIYVFFGIALIYASIKKNQESYSSEFTGYSKCPKCKTAYHYLELEDGLCPKCNIETIDLDSYFDKYPEEVEE